MRRENAIDALYEREYDTLCRSAYRMLGDWDAAQDLVQDTFLLALLKQEELPCHPAPGAWLTETLRNLIRNERRRLVSHGEVPLADVELLPAEAPTAFADILPTSLTAEERELLTGRFERQMSYRELGAMLGISDGACRVKLFRTVEKCRKLL